MHECGAPLSGYLTLWAGPLSCARLPLTGLVWGGNGVEERGQCEMFGAVVRWGVGCVLLSDVCGICYGCEWGGCVLSVFACPRLVVICTVWQFGRRVMFLVGFRLLSFGNTFAYMRLCSCPLLCFVFICIFTVGEGSLPPLRCGSCCVYVSIVVLVLSGISRFCFRVHGPNFILGIMSFGPGSLFGFVCGGSSFEFFCVWWNVRAAFQHGRTG